MLKKNNFIQKYNKNAFSIIESIIAIIIVSTLTIFLMHTTNLYYTISGMRITEERMTKINDALLSYVKTNGHLPCPASLTAKNKEESFGTSTKCIADIKNKDGIIITGDQKKKIIHGTIPIKELGLDRNYMYDKWHRRIAYAVILDLTIDTKSFIEYTTHITKNNIQAFTIRNIKGKTVSTSGIEQPAYLLLSYGKTGIGAHNSNGVITNKCDTTSLEGSNCSHSNIFIYNSSIQQGAKNNYFDDILSWLSYSAVLNAYKIHNTNQSLVKKDLLLIANDYTLENSDHFKTFITNITKQNNEEKVWFIDNCQNDKISSIITKKNLSKSCLVRTNKNNTLTFLRPVYQNDLLVIPTAGLFKIENEQIKLIVNLSILHKIEETLKQPTESILSKKNTGLYIVEDSSLVKSLNIKNNDIIYINNNRITNTINNAKPEYGVVLNKSTNKILSYSKNNGWI